MKRIRHEIAAEFMHTWPRHNGSVVLAAPIFGIKPDSLARALHRARKDGIEVKFVDDAQRERR